MLIQTFLILLFFSNFAASVTDVCSNLDSTQLCIKVVCTGTEMTLTFTKQPDSNGAITSNMKYVTVGDSSDCTYDWPDTEVVITEPYATSKCITTTQETEKDTYSADIWAKQLSEFVTSTDSGLLAQCVKPKQGFLQTIETAQIQTAKKETSTGEVEEEVVYKVDIIPKEIVIDIVNSDGNADSETTEEVDEAAGERVNEKTIGEDIDINFDLNDDAKAAGFNDISLKSITVSGGDNSPTIKLIEEDCQGSSGEAKELVKSYTRSTGKRELKTIAISIDKADQMVYEGEMVLWKNDYVHSCSERKKRQSSDEGYVVSFQKAMNVSVTDVKSDGSSSGGSSGSGDDGCDENQNILYLQLIVGLTTINGMNLITSFYFGIVMTYSR